MDNVVIPVHYGDQRIDKVLSDYFGLSRNFFHQLFDRNLVLLVSTDSSSPVKKSYKVQGGETIALPELARYQDNQILAESPVIQLEIKHQTSDYMVLYKPKGVLSHPKTLFDVSVPSVAGFLYHQFGTVPSIAGFVRAGIVHRLDKDTDGLMIVALSEKGLRYFKHLFDQKAKMALGELDTQVPLHKYYRAMCDITKQGVAWLRNHAHAIPHILQTLVYPKIATVGYPKMGVTKIMDIKQHFCYDKECVEITMELLTGRTHQVRYHLSSVGLPIIGDFLYNPLYDDKAASELQLTAYGLDFVDPDGCEVSIRI